MSQITEAELLIKHKKERRDLQSQIQSMKKTITKGDKKKKKEVTEQIARLEQELDDRQNAEIEGLKNVPIGDSVTVTVDSVDSVNEFHTTSTINTTSKTTSTPKEDNETDEDTTSTGKEIRVTKAQKRRNRKAAEDKQREERIRQQDEENKKGPRLIETDKINNILNELGLKIYSIPADGNCLYCSVTHQLKITGRHEVSASDLRKLTAKYMREHKEDILPFMSHDFDEIFTEEQYEKYCNKVANTTEWGGQVEILALSNALKCPIKIIQATALPTVQGEDFTGPPLVLTYHRHLYRLGEHYNSTMPV